MKSAYFTASGIDQHTGFIIARWFATLNSLENKGSSLCIVLDDPSSLHRHDLSAFGIKDEHINELISKSYCTVNGSMSIIMVLFSDFTCLNLDPFLHISSPT